MLTSTWLEQNPDVSLQKRETLGRVIKLYMLRLSCMAVDGVGPLMRWRLARLGNRIRDNFFDDFSVLLSMPDSLR